MATANNGFNPLGLANDAASVLDVLHGGQPVQNPVKAAANLPKQEAHYAPQPVKNVLNTASSLGNIVTFITSPANWMRLGEILFGVILLLMGLRTLAGLQSPVAVVSRTARKVAL